MRRTIEPDLNYCPQCHDEYRAEIIRCAACAVELIPGSVLLRAEKTKADRSLPLRPDDDLVAVSKGAVLQMQQLQALLKREGIPSRSVNEDGGCGQGCCGPSLTVQVRKADLKDVEAILAQDYLRSTGLCARDLSAAGTVFDAAANSALCPACGCRFSTAQSACPDCGLCFS
jgi:hypothetical protein